MPLLELTTDQIIELIKQLPLEEKRIVMSVLSVEFQGEASFVTDAKTQEWLKAELHQREGKRYPSIDAETQEWLEADLGAELPLYDWGSHGIPQGEPVKYIAGQGLVIEGDKKFVQQP